jgi:hypothetical protein
VTLTQRTMQRVLVTLLMAATLIAAPPESFADQLKPQAAATFDRYVQISEQNMPSVTTGKPPSAPFLRIDGLPPAQRDAAVTRLKKGEVIVERLQTLDSGQPVPVPGGLIHHWAGTVFIPHATLAQTLAFLQDYNNQYKFYSPDVQRSKLIQHNGDEFQISQRLRETKIITITLDANYDVKYTLLGPDSASAVSRSTRIAEVANAGKPGEFEKTPGDDGGYLWRLYSYWRFLQRDGGTYIQLEAISLTRDIPTGLGWLVGPFVSSIPRESLEFTLTRTRDALAKDRIVRGYRDAAGIFAFHN